MRFNKILLDNYIETKEGKASYDFFNNINFYIRNSDSQLFDVINSQLIEPMEKENLQSNMEVINSAIEANESLRKANEYTKREDIDAIDKEVEEFIEDCLKKSEGLVVRDLLGYIMGFSLLFHYFEPEKFFPYFYYNHFFKLENIFTEFDIPLPDPPSKRKYFERIMYYTDLCKALYDFRIQMGLNPIELNVFLYSFAPKLIDNFDLDYDLPKPSKVYIAGGSKEDSEWIKETEPESIWCWAGNINTLPGDIVMIYEVSPISAIKTIWRAISPGFYDPFSYYGVRQWVGHHIKIPAISYTDLCENLVWREKGIVKSHMQGVAGTPCTIEEYKEIRKMLKYKKYDVSLLPQLMTIGLESQVDPDNEKEVEEKLLEPLLKKLGFTEKDWKRQISVRMGRGQYVYPDYVIFPKTQKGEESGYFIWEAKFSIPHRKQLKYDFFQAKSYAMRLGTIGLGIVSREGIWLSFQEDGFMFDKIKTFSWSEINNSDIFNELLISLGRKGKKI